MLDFDGYRRNLASYYDDVSATAYRFSAPELAREYDSAFATPRSWMRDLALALQDVARQRRVIEIAAGHGRWTRYLARTARQVLVTDASARMLVQARELIGTANDVPRDRCEFLKLDAFQIDQAPGEFDAGVAVNFFQHIPRARHGDFLGAFHRRLGAGASALLAMNRPRPETRARAYRKPGQPDVFEARPRPDGSVCEVIDNVFTERELQTMLQPYASEFRFHIGAKFYWITYRVR